MTFLIGLFFGLVCGVFKQPIPAPPTLDGLLGIVGVCVGYWMVLWMIKN